jgi:hypothetical protein
MLWNMTKHYQYPMTKRGLVDAYHIDFEAGTKMEAIRIVGTLRGDMNSVRVLVYCFLCLVLLVGGAMAQPTSAQAQITFVQITDAHLFDDDEFANYSALDWAVSTINRLTAAGRPIDFVVYTGDLGLRNIAFPPTQCEIAPLKSRSDSRSLDSVIDRLVEVLDRLTVRRLYFLPGNNDLAREQLGDIGRYQCFLSKLQERLNHRAQERIPFEPLAVANLEPDSTFVDGGIRLLGLNDASLKNQQEYEPWCSEQLESIAPSIWAACPQVQVGRLSRSLKDGAPALIFMHIPYLRDPFPPRAQELPGAWDIPTTLRSEWEQAACSNNVIAIFAGHFHDSNRDVYGARGRRTLQVSRCVSSKTWVAPPLAQEYQEAQTVQARGFLMVTVTSSAVNECTIYWLPGANDAADSTTSSCR